MILSDEAPTDAAAIRAVVTAAFGQPGEADLIERLRADGDAVISLVAAERGEVLGHILLSRMAAPFRALGLAPVAVDPRHQHRGIGSRLIRAGLARAARDGWQGLFVVGDPRYYRRFGFDAALAGGFDSPYAGPHFMALALDGALPTTGGPVAYASAFAALA